MRPHSSMDSALAEDAMKRIDLWIWRLVSGRNLDRDRAEWRAEEAFRKGSLSKAKAPSDIASALCAVRVIQQVRSRPAEWFRLGTPDDKDIWCYIVAAYAHLEDLAVLFLWEHDGQQGQTEEYLGKKNLGALHS